MFDLELSTKTCLGSTVQKSGEMAEQIRLTANASSMEYGLLLLGRSEVLGSLRHYVQAQSQVDHSIDRLEEEGGDT